MSRRTSWLVVCAAVVVLIGATALIVFAGGGKHEKRTTSAGRRSAGQRSAGQRSAGHRSAGQRSAGRRSSVVTVDPRVQGRTIPAGFLGVSIEYWAIAAYAGRKPGAINPLLPRLIRALAPGQTAVLRIGGVSTDQTWWPVPGVKRPPGVFYKLNRRRLEVMRKLTDEAGARLILGITFEADSRALAGAEARAMVTTIGRNRIDAFELGNEPELYGNPKFAWYTRHGHNVMGRPIGYGAPQFTRDFATIGAGLAQVPLAGPASGAADWLNDLGPFIASVPRLGMVTVHRYPFEACTGEPASPSYPTIDRVLSPLGTTDQAAGLAPYVAVAHAHGLPLRIAETGNFACGNPPQVSNSFALAVWAIDALFAYAQVGVDGVNVHTWPGAPYQLFGFQKTRSGWRGFVEPEYYGLLMFSQAAPAGSRLLKTRSSNPKVRAWATRAPDGTIRITLINDATTSAQRLAVAVRGSRGAGTLERLLAPSASATTGVTLGGQTFGETGSGDLTGPPVRTTVNADSDAYRVSLPPASAALLTLR